MREHQNRRSADGQGTVGCWGGASDWDQDAEKWAGRDFQRICHLGRATKRVSTLSGFRRRWGTGRSLQAEGSAEARCRRVRKQGEWRVATVKGNKKMLVSDRPWEALESNIFLIDKHGGIFSWWFCQLLLMKILWLCAQTPAPHTPPSNICTPHKSSH